MLMNVNLSSRLWPAAMGLAGVALHRRAVVSLPGLSHSLSVTCDSGAVLGATSAGRGQDWRAAEVTAAPVQSARLCRDSVVHLEGVQEAGPDSCAELGV